MATTYSFIRALSGGTWDIDNPLDVDSNGYAVPLSRRIGGGLPGHVFELRCNEDVASVIFAVALTASEEATLDTIVAAHKAAAGTPQPPDVIAASFSVLADELSVPAGAWPVRLGASFIPRRISPYGDYSVIVLGEYAAVGAGAQVRLVQVNGGVSDVVMVPKNLPESGWAGFRFSSNNVARPQRAYVAEFQLNGATSLDVRFVSLLLKMDG